MSFTADSKLGDILDQKPAALAVLGKHAGAAGSMLQSQIGMARGMSIKQIAGFVNWPQEKIDALLADLNAL